MNPSYSADATFGRRREFSLDGQKYTVPYHPIADEAEMAAWIKKNVKSKLQQLIDSAKQAAQGDQDLYRTLLARGFDAAMAASDPWPPPFRSDQFREIILSEQAVPFILSRAVRHFHPQTTQETIDQILVGPANVDGVRQLLAFYLWGIEVEASEVEEAKN